ncbi:MAG: thioredoxin family protein [Nitrospirota bacterium]|nr:thioredoxin family protein [Nitrospirota bacterium]
MKIPVRKRYMLLVLLTVFLTGACAASSAAQTASREEAGRVILYFFWGDGCPHCEKEKLYLDAAVKKYPELEVRSFEVWHNRSNAVYLSRMAEAAGIKSTGVPVTFIDTVAFAGFNDGVAREIENKIKYCVQNKGACIEPSESPRRPVSVETRQVITLPLVGELDASELSLPALTVMLGGLDSFNPCAFFVLFFLLSLLIHAQSRKRMVLIGGTFVFFSGFIYFVFMAAWLNLFMVAGRLVIITVIAGIIALTVALINIKDFFFFAKGVSLSIPEKAKPKLFERMRNLLKSTSVPSMIAGTIVLAIAANSYELLCTAGFPMVFTRILTLQNFSMGQYYLYLALYNCIYVLPLASIVVIFTVTMGARKLTEWQGRKLKLLSGLMMFFLGLILLIDPVLLNNMFLSAGLLAAVGVLFVFIVFLTKKFSPQIAGEKG